MKVLKDVYEETRVLYHHKKSGFWVALFFFINKLISKMYIHFAYQQVDKQNVHTFCCVYV